jgi:hypothetical protein
MAQQMFEKYCTPNKIVFKECGSTMLTSASLPGTKELLVIGWQTLKANQHSTQTIKNKQWQKNHSKGINPT